MLYRIICSYIIDGKGSSQYGLTTRKSNAGEQRAENE